MEIVQQPHGGAIVRTAKGETGNPNGRPKGAMSWGKVFESVMPDEGFLRFEQIEEVEPVFADVLGADGKPTGKQKITGYERTGNVFKYGVTKVPNQKQIALAMVKSAKGGNAVAFDKIADRMEGKPPQNLNLGNQDKDEPLKIEFVESFKPPKTNE